MPDLETTLCRVMGSAGQGLITLPHNRVALQDTVLFSGLEKLPGSQDPDSQSWRSLDSPSPPATPEQSLPTFCLQYFDMLYPDDSNWVPKGLGENQQANNQGGRTDMPKEPEQCPIIDSQGLSLTPEMEYQANLHLEEHSLEQVQSMVVGEVLKDIETACKLLNIAAGECLWFPLQLFPLTGRTLSQVKHPRSQLGKLGILPTVDTFKGSFGVFQ